MSALSGEIIVCGQHSGNDVQLRIFGDEFYARRESTDGYTVVYDVDVGCYCYALLAAGRFVSSGIPIGKTVPSGLRRHLKETPDVRNEVFGRRHQEIRTLEHEPEGAATRTVGPDSGLLSGRKLLSGTVRGLTVLVNFDDVTTGIAASDVDAMLNDTDYSQNGNFCSVREYFHIVSDGKLDYTNTVVGPVTLSKRRSHYIGNLLVEEALSIVVNELGVDLAQFDSRNEGIVDAINILYAGESQYNGNLWPHNSVAELHYGAIRTHFYLLTGLGSVKADLRIGTICHENGHLLCRFPDMYDYGKRDGDSEKSQGIGRYCLMGSGNHLNDRRTPAPVCGYLRDLAGWVDDIVLLNDSGAHNAKQGDYGRVMKYLTDLPNEYFVVENRSQMNLDAYLPSSGLAVYHCDTQGSNEWQDGTRNRHYQCALLQADGHLDLENNRNAGDAGDLFSGTPGLALSDGTVPSSRLWNGTDSELVLSDIGPSGETIGFRIGESRKRRTASDETFPNLLIPDNDPVGVVSRISLAASGTAAALAVRVELVHSWIGDLRVILIAPDGSEAVLHDHTGSNGDDIMTTYRSTNHAALKLLEGKDITGVWTLGISDAAVNDVGRLLHWGLSIDVTPSANVVEHGSRPNDTIPDADNIGIADIVSFVESGIIKDMVVTIDIEHGYIGDLQVDLVSPDGTSARLHHNDGRNRADIKRSYDIRSTPALRGLVGQPLHGDWTLRIRDTAALDEGTLKSWLLQLEY